MPHYAVENQRNEPAKTWKEYNRNTRVLSYQIGSIPVGAKFEGVVVGTHIMSEDDVVQVGIVYTRMKWLKEIPAPVPPDTDPPDLPPPTHEVPNLRRLRPWGDPVTITYGYDVNVVGTTNWQNLKLWNFGTRQWGAVSNFLRIPRVDIDKLKAMQIPDRIEYPGGVFVNYSQRQKMNWLCAYRGKIYMYDGTEDSWETAPRIRWGTTAIGGNFVQVEKYEVLRIPHPSNTSEIVNIEMAKLKGFRKTDWARPLPELISEGLVHRCYCVYQNNGFGDSPRGVVYSPFWSPLDWTHVGNVQPDAFWIPTAWMY